MPAAAGRADSVHQALRDVVPVAPAPLVGMSRTQAITILVIDQAGKEARGMGVRCGAARRCVFTQLPPYGFEGLAIDDGGMLACVVARTTPIGARSNEATQA